MSTARKRFELALNRLEGSDWAKFEKLASAFLASELPGIRTMAAPEGDGGRDAELFFSDGNPLVSVQYSVQEDWKSKIQKTVDRLKTTFPDRRILIYVTNQEIGARADEIKGKFGSEGYHIDVRDRNWLVERLHSNVNAEKAGEELSRDIVDRYLESAGVIEKKAVALSAIEKKTAFVYLEMQLANDQRQKGLTKLSYEALVKAALRGTDSQKRLKKGEIVTKIQGFMPNHPPDFVQRKAESALRALQKNGVNYHTATDDYCLSHDEVMKVHERLASIDLLDKAFSKEIKSSVESDGVVSTKQVELCCSAIRRCLESYLLKRGEAFASAVARKDTTLIGDDGLSSIVMSESLVSSIRVSGVSSVDYVTAKIKGIVSNPTPSAMLCMRQLSDAYTLMAFLEETPDVQQVTTKMFSRGEIWMDTSVLLPLFAEQVSQNEPGPFSEMVRQARNAGAKLYVTPGVIEEVERHFNRCISYLNQKTNQKGRWVGTVPFVYASYILAGRRSDSFASWLENFRGEFRPEDDIAQYLLEKFGIEQVGLDDYVKCAPDDLRSAMQEEWLSVHESRRGAKSDDFDLAAMRLAEHDVESHLGVMMLRQKEAGASNMGYSAWWLTMDSAAPQVHRKVHDKIGRKPPHMPLLSVDFLLEYIAFGPNRGRISRENLAALPIIASGALFDSLPEEVLEVAAKVREDCASLPEHVIQRRIRDAVDKQKMKIGPIHRAGLDSIKKDLWKRV